MLLPSMAENRTNKTYWDIKRIYKMAYYKKRIHLLLPYFSSGAKIEFDQPTDADL